MRIVTGINKDWYYAADFKEEYLSPSFPVEGWAKVELPHANKELPYNGFDEKEYQFVSCYARKLEVPSLAGGKRAFLDFQGVMTACVVWLDGVRAGSHDGGYTGFSVEITRLVAGDGIHRLVVQVDSTERADIPPFGHVVDYLCYGGIYREVSLRIQEQFFMRECFARPLDALDFKKRLELDVEIDFGSKANSLGGAKRELSVSCMLMDGERIVIEARGPVSDSDNIGSAAISVSDLEGLRNWDIDDPVLYGLSVSLFNGGHCIDTLSLRVGFRSAEFRSEGFFLNGRLLPIIGLNRHQSWPYVGYAMPARAQVRDAAILKNELGVNMVRTSHYPQSVHFLDACDEIGLLVFEELPGWAHIGNAAWKDNACCALEEMIRRDRNHASIVMWGVRINESRDDHDFYARTNEIAKRLDATRQRGGVRFIEKSEFLEDVYTFNDFSHFGGSRVLKKPRDVTKLNKNVPYLVTEHNGHMFPTKRFDNEERLAEHALRHLRVMEAARAIPGIAGAIGWCAFDYNTHKDFGSGDRICYHGVMDMFRIPKYAAASYASQRDISRGVVLEAASIFAKGERSSARLLPIVVHTNCDEIILYRGGIKIGSYHPAVETFPHLAHPPVVIRDLVGEQLADTKFSLRDRVLIKRLIGEVLAGDYDSLKLIDKLRFGLLLVRYRMSMVEAEALVGKYALAWGKEDETFEIIGFSGGKEVARRRYGGNAYAYRLSAIPDDIVLRSGDWDTTRVVIKLEDQYGNLYPFGHETVEINVTGPGSAIGPRNVALIGGCIAFWIKTEGAAGTIGVEIKGTRFEAAALSILVE